MHENIICVVATCSLHSDHNMFLVPLPISIHGRESPWDSLLVNTHFSCIDVSSLPLSLLDALLSLFFYSLFFCPRQHLSPKTEMWWVVLVRRRVMEFLRHSRCRVKAACHTRYFSPPTDSRFSITSLCLHIWRRDGSCQTPGKGDSMLLCHLWYDKKSNFTA